MHRLQSTISMSALQTSQSKYPSNKTLLSSAPVFPCHFPDFLEAGSHKGPDNARCHCASCHASPHYPHQQRLSPAPRHYHWVSPSPTTAHFHKISFTTRFSKVRHYLVRFIHIQTFIEPDLYFLGIHYLLSCFHQICKPRLTNWSALWVTWVRRVGG